MKKEDLKTGMLCQLGNGDITLFVNDTFIYNDKSEHLDLCYYTDNLERDNGKYTIVKISNVLSGYLITPSKWTQEALNAFLLWERKEVPEYVEVLSNIYSQHIAVGEICKVESVTESGCYNLIANNYRSKHISWIYTEPKIQLKPSTKEAYEAQFKVNEMTIEELEKLTGLTNLKIKK